MAYTILSALLTLAFFFTILQILKFRNNIVAAKQSGFKSLISPVYFQSIPWILAQYYVIPLAQKLPHSWTRHWLPLSLWFRAWHLGYRPYEDVGEDSVMIASPSGNVLSTCSPEVLEQILSRRHDFPKEMYLNALMNIYGTSFTASEGAEHLRHRRIVGPAFGERTHKTVWQESISQTEEMLKMWAQSSGHVTRLNEDTSKLFLHVFSKALLNKSMSWFDDPLPSSGHKLSYDDAINNVYKNYKILYLIPPFLRAHSPFPSHRNAHLAYVEFEKYMQEMVADTAGRFQKNHQMETGDFLENLVKASMPTSDGGTATTLPTGDVYSNIFALIMAGHETSANTLVKSIVLLATHPDFQEAMQEEIDSLLHQDGNSDKTSDATSLIQGMYGTVFTKLWHGRVGAVVKESLRVWTPVTFIMKTNPNVQKITLQEGKEHTIPANTLILINTSAVHRNPKYWPKDHSTSKSESNNSPNQKVHDNDPDYLTSTSASLSDFHPERWLDTAATKHEPAKSSYIPFSEGFRSCYGTRFAQIELCAVLSRIFYEYSVELADQSPRGQEYARKCMSEYIEFEMGLRLGRDLPLRFVKRRR